MKRLIDKYALVLSMVIGAIGYRIFCTWSAALSPMIALMLFFTFCKVDPKDLRLHSWHWLVLCAQLLLAVGTYYATAAICHAMGVDDSNTAILSQGAMMCLIMPTATAAPIIAGKLGGSIQNLTTFTLLSNFATAIVVPAFFPLVHPSGDMGFGTEMLMILRRVSPLLIGPFLAAWLLRIIYDNVQKHRGSDVRFHLSAFWAQMPFYLWAGTLIILMGNITDMLLHGEYSGWIVPVLAVFSLIACLAQFGIGHLIGSRFPAGSRGKEYQDVVINPAAVPSTMSGVSRLTAGQAMGQKNTTLGIWLCQAFLNPMSSIGAAFYIIWQNAYNQWQLYRAANYKSGGD